MSSNNIERRKVTTRAAEILRDEAHSLAEGHTSNGRWPTPKDAWHCDADLAARNAHDEMVGLAIQLDLIGAEQPADRNAIIEECAKVADGAVSKFNSSCCDYMATEIAGNIRALSDSKGTK